MNLETLKAPILAATITTMSQTTFQQTFLLYKTPPFLRFQTEWTNLYQRPSMWVLSTLKSTNTVSQDNKSSQTSFLTVTILNKTLKYYGYIKKQDYLSE